MAAGNEDLRISEERESGVEKTSERPFRNKYLGAVFALVSADVFNFSRGRISNQFGRSKYTFHQREPELEVDVEKALQVLPHLPVFDGGRTTEEDEAEIRDPELRQKAITAYKRVIKSFVDHGVISADLVVQTARLVKPDEIFLNNSLVSEFKFEDYVFPESEDKKPQLKVSMRSIRSKSERIRRTATMVGVPLNEDQIEAAAYWAIIAHEYGHAVESAVRFMRMDQTYKGRSDVEDEEESKRKKHAFQSIAQDMNRQVSRLVSDPELDLPDDPHFPQQSARVRYAEWVGQGDHNINRERIGAGFECLGLRLALIAQGVTPEQSSVIVRNIKGDIKAEFGELVKLDQLVARKGLKAVKLRVAMHRLQEDDAIKNAGLQNRIPAYGYFPVGYFKPLSEDQLTQFIKLTLPSPRQ